VLFSVTYLATSPKLAKFSVTERMAGYFFQKLLQVPHRSSKKEPLGSGDGLPIGARLL